MRFIIEQQAADGHWFIRGSERYEYDAIYHARRYAREDLKPDGTYWPFRVQDMRTKKIVTITV